MPERFSFPKGIFFTILAYSLTSCSLLYGQTLISGVINQYTAVSNVDAGTSTLTVADPSLFSFDDRVLLVQMQGAVINSGNSSAFGTITNLNGAGAYEFASVCEVDLGTNEVTLQKQLVNTYNPTSVSQPSIQLVTVPKYADVNVTGTLQAQAWNGSTGGILVFEATGTVRLEADIDVSGQGFRGGAFENLNLSCNFLTNTPDWYYSQASLSGGKKGEGIAAYISAREYGRGPQANGGGGGNNHNTGGAGGGNYATGGQGGERSTGTFSCQGPYEGEGGIGLFGLGYTIANPYVFMGGGGGSGHGNNNEGEDAGNGGGIIIIRTQTFNGNGFSLKANGLSAADSDSDGGSGGGAGGAILLAADFYTADPFSVETDGGDGGGTAINCEGPGGGGAGGVIWLSNALGAGVSRSVSGGIAGGAAACGNATQGALNGSVGAELLTLTLTEGGIGSGCVLPLNLIGFEALEEDQMVSLSWLVASELAGTIYRIERSANGRDFQEIQLLTATGTDQGLKSYSHQDRSPLPGSSWYRIQWEEPSGMSGYSRLAEVLIQKNMLSVSIIPQPIKQGDPIQIILSSGQSTVAYVKLLSIRGEELFSKKIYVPQGENTFSLPSEGLSSGMYMLSVTSSLGKTIETCTIW